MAKTKIGQWVLVAGVIAAVAWLVRRKPEDRGTAFEREMREAQTRTELNAVYNKYVHDPVTGAVTEWWKSLPFDVCTRLNDFYYARDQELLATSPI